MSLHWESLELCQWQLISAKLLSHDLLKKVPSQTKTPKFIHWDILPLHDYYCDFYFNCKSSVKMLLLMVEDQKWREFNDVNSSLKFVNIWPDWKCILWSRTPRYKNKQCFRSIWTLGYNPNFQIYHVPLVLIHIYPFFWSKIIVLIP